LKNVFKSIKSVLYNLKYIALIKLKENIAASLFFILLSVVLPFSSWSFGSSENYSLVSHDFFFIHCLWR